MSIYYDTGVLVPLYVEEVFSDAVSAHVESHRAAIHLNLFQQLEMENALRLKVFRGELEAAQCDAVLAKVKSDQSEGRLVPRAVDWVDAMEEARSIGSRVTVKAGCRTLDVIHVAIAVGWACSQFVSADGRQIEAARKAGLKTVDLRSLHQETDENTMTEGAQP